MFSLLIVEDDPLIGQAAANWLTRDNHVHWARSVAEANSLIASESPDIILLDLGLPDGDGLDVLRYLKRQKSTAAVLIMTAYGEVERRIEGLDLGADDYLVKPVNFKELDARIRAVKRRRDGLLSSVIEHANLVVDIEARTVEREGVPVHLSNKEFSILAILIQRRNHYFSRDMLAERLYNLDESTEGNAIEVHISALRKKLGKSLIRNTRGLGYIIDRQSA